MPETDILSKLTTLEDTLKCGICSKLFEEPTVIGKCGHTFCKKCVSQLPEHKCPCCKVPVDRNDSFEDKQLNDILPLVSQLKLFFSHGQSKENDKNETNEVNLDVSVIGETPLPSIMVKPLSAEEIEHACSSRVTKPVKCKSSDCGAECNTIQEKVMKTPKSFMPKKRPLSSPGVKASKRTPFRFSSPLSKNKNLQHSSKQLSASLFFPPSNLEKRNMRGETLLHVAVIKGKIDRVKELLEKGANPNVKDNAGWTPLHEACNHGYFEIMKLLVGKQANLNAAGEGAITPLHDAIINGRMEIAKYLALKGADIYIKTALQRDAIDLCIRDVDKKAILNSFCLSAKCVKSVPEKEIPQKKKMKMVLLYTALDEKQKELLQKCAELLKAEVVEDFSTEVTHVVTSVDTNGQCNRTLKVLQGILAGKWILSTQWLDICLEYKKHVDEEVFEVPGTKQIPDTFGPKQARENSAKELPKLFQGLSFYISGTITSPLPPKEEISQLIQLGGGKMLTREPRPETVNLEKRAIAHHATNGPLSDISHYILYEDKPPRNKHIFADHICTVNVRWILDCICSFKLVNHENFVS